MGVVCVAGEQQIIDTDNLCKIIEVFKKKPTKQCAENIQLYLTSKT
jgi:hypothetical protein